MKSNIIWFLITAVLGLAAIIIPAMFLDYYRYYDEFSFYNVYALGIEKFSFWSGIFLVFSGGISAFLNGGNAFKWGLATMITYPFITIVDADKGASSHNLFPMDMIFCIPFLFFIGSVGALGGLLIKKINK